MAKNQQKMFIGIRNGELLSWSLDESIEDVISLILEYCGYCGDGGWIQAQEDGCEVKPVIVSWS